MSDSGDFDRSAVSFKAEENDDNSSSDEEDAAQDQKKPRLVAVAARILRKKPSNAKQKRPMPRLTNTPGKRGRKEQPPRVPQKGKETLHGQWSRDPNGRKVFNPRTISPFIGKKWAPVSKSYPFRKTIGILQAFFH